MNRRSEKRNRGKICGDCVLADCFHSGQCLTIVAPAPYDLVCECPERRSKPVVNRPDFEVKTRSKRGEILIDSESVPDGIGERLTPIIEYLVRAQLPLPTFMRAIEQKYIGVAQTIYGSKTNVARALGVCRNTIGNKTTRRKKLTQQDRRRYTARERRAMREHRR